MVKYLTYPFKYTPVPDLFVFTYQLLSELSHQTVRKSTQTDLGLGLVK